MQFKFSYLWHFKKPVLEAESIYHLVDRSLMYFIASFDACFCLHQNCQDKTSHMYHLRSGQRWKSKRDFINAFEKWLDAHNCPWSLDDITNEKHDVFWLNIYQLTGKITCNLIGSAKQIMHLKTSGNCKYTLRCCYQL